MLQQLSLLAAPCHADASLAPANYGHTVVVLLLLCVLLFLFPPVLLLLSLSSVVQALLSGPLLQPIANLLLDPVERCRVTALQLLLDAAPQLAGALCAAGLGSYAFLQCAHSCMPPACMFIEGTASNAQRGEGSLVPHSRHVSGSAGAAHCARPHQHLRTLILTLSCHMAVFFLQIGVPCFEDCCLCWWHAWAAYLLTAARLAAHTLLLINFLSRCPADLSPVLQGLLPVLVARMGRLPVDDPAPGSTHCY